MNHLAHLFLSQTNTNLMVGNFIADRVKGKELLKYSEEIQKGIEMHRAIDAFTDTHAVVAKSKARLYPKHGKYAAVIVDIFYDHILAKSWKAYSPISLEQFADSTYKRLESKKNEMPETSQRILYYMEEGEWLTSYANISGIHRAFASLIARTTFNSNMESAAEDLSQDYKLYEAEFQEFFPELIAHCTQWTHVED